MCSSYCLLVLFVFLAVACVLLCSIGMVGLAGCRCLSHGVDPCPLPRQTLRLGRGRRRRCPQGPQGSSRRGARPLGAPQGIRLGRLPRRKRSRGGQMLRVSHRPQATILLKVHFQLRQYGFSLLPQTGKLPLPLSAPPPSVQIAQARGPRSATAKRLWS